MEDWVLLLLMVRLVGEIMKYKKAERLLCMFLNQEVDVELQR